MIYVTYIILIALTCAVVYLFMKLESLESVDDMDTIDDFYDDLEELKRDIPRVHVNDKNEAIITLPDGKTEIYNYDLKNKK